MVSRSDLTRVRAQLPRAPSREVWDRLTVKERERAVAALPTSLPADASPPPEGIPHSEAKIETRDALDLYYRRQGRRVFLAAELLTFYPDEQPFAPDLSAVMDPAQSDEYLHNLTRWVVSLEGRGLDFVLEVHVGGDRKRDAEEKAEQYARVGIPEYFIYDRRSQRLSGHRLSSSGAGSYVPIVPQGGFVFSQVLGLDLRVQDGRLRFFNATALLPDSRELIERLSTLAGELEARVDAEARLREEETRRREEETRRREEETRLREEAERRLAALQAELEQLKRKQ